MKKKKIKYLELQETVIKSITSGKCSVGDKLPTGREMAKILNASYVTVNTVMRGLEERGYVRRVHGSGVFVTDPKDALKQNNNIAIKQVGALVPMRGDLYQNFSETLIKELEKENYYLTPLVTSKTLDTVSKEEQYNQIAKFANCNFKSLIVAGNRHIPFRILHKYRKSFNQMIFVIQNESDMNFPDLNGVICDYVEVGYLAAKKLLESGRKKVAFITYEPFTEMENRQNGNRRLGLDYEIINGAEKAFEEAGISFIDNFDIIYDNVIHLKKRTTLMKVSEHIKRDFDGFLCMGDNRAQHVYAASAELNITPGIDLGVVGLYNTSWTEMLTPKLSSISINECKIAKIAANMVLNKALNEKITVKPKLIDRGSC